MSTLRLPEPTPAPAPATVRSPPASHEPAPPPRRFWPIGVAFVLGIGLAAAVAVPLVRADREHAVYLEHARRVFADGHYTEPPGDNVKELVAAGLLRWPDDGTLAQLRSSAEQELVTMAMAAQNAGDVVGARELAEDAYELDPTDNSARYARAQADDAYKEVMANVASRAGPPRLLFESPANARVGETIEMRCTVSPGSAGAQAKITGVRLTVFPNGRSEGGSAVALSNPSAMHVVASTTMGAEGSYDVTFEATVDGVVVRAMRDLDVIPAAIK